jgi:hypothetical protein
MVIIVATGDRRAGLAPPIAQVKVRQDRRRDCHAAGRWRRGRNNGHLASDHGCFDRPSSAAAPFMQLSADALERRALQTRRQKSDKEAGLFRGYLAGRPYRIHGKSCRFEIL